MIGTRRGTMQRLGKPASTPSAWAVSLLGELIAHRSESGSERSMVEHLAQAAAELGLECDLWCCTEADLEARYGPLPPHRPLTDRPTLVIRLPGDAEAPSLLFNAHSDVVSAPDPQRWSSDPWSGVVRDGKMYGRGACDVKGPLVSALWAMRMLSEVPAGRRGDVLLEVVPGEEDCVGLGTLTSVARGVTADAVIVLEPTDGLPTCASRSGLRFEIECRGRATHGATKWLGRDAIAFAVRVHQTLADIERSWTEDADELFQTFPILRPATADRICGGEWQGMICDKCVISGYLECLPRDNLDLCRRRFADGVEGGVKAAGFAPAEVTVRFTETYAGHRTDTAAPLCRAAVRALSESGGADGPFRWSAFNAGCEAGCRANRLGTPTLVWGPGRLSDAHGVDESVDIGQLERCAELFARTALVWAERAGHP